MSIKIYIIQVCSDSQDLKSRFLLFLTSSVIFNGLLDYSFLLFAETQCDIYCLRVKD